ncbi:MAG: phage tail protein [Betaproteobacteria bacterium]|nr:phage tail protein [Betaproteobacteria bacterium]
MGSGKKVTIGYWYSMGLHMGLGRGPLDEIREIVVGDKTAWTGSASGNAEFQINQPNLFGGEKKEGGIVGPLKVLMGDVDQPVFPRLAAMLGGLVPAFRGVASVFFDGRISAMTPYPKPWKFRVRRTNAGWENGAWYPERAAIWLAGNQIKAMNPAHILMQLYTDTKNGRGLPPARIDDASFRAAADKLYAEGFGMCLKFNAQDSIVNFAQSVIDHIGGSMFVDRRTGKLKLRLVRDDYDPATLPIFDADSGLLAVEEFESAAIFDGPSEVVVKFISPLARGEMRSVRQRNAAAITTAGGAVVSLTREYPGLPTADLAARVALRDLKSMGGNLKKFTVKLNRRGALIAPGDVFRIAAPEVGVNNMVVRAGRCEYGEGTDGTVTIIAVEDVFGLPTTSWLGQDPGGFVRPDLMPQPVPAQRAVEAGYRDLLLRIGDANARGLADSAAFVAMLATSPSGLALGFDVAVSVGAGGFSVGNADMGTFCPAAALAASVDRSATVLPMVDASMLDGVEIGSAAWLEDELVRIDAINTVANTITVGRGCGDTIPAAHPAGALLWCYGSAQDYGFDEREYVQGMTAQVRALTRTGSGTLALASAPTSTIALAGRAARPYPPANVRLNNLRWPASISGALTIAWSHRDRLTQADLLVDWLAGNTGPETGVTYNLYLYGGATPGNMTLRKTETGFTGTSYTWTDEDADPATAGNQLWPAVRVVLETERGGLKSVQRFDWSVTR